MKLYDMVYILTIDECDDEYLAGVSNDFDIIVNNMIEYIKKEKNISRIEVWDSKQNKMKKRWWNGYSIQYLQELYFSNPTFDTIASIINQEMDGVD